MTTTIKMTSPVKALLVAVRDGQDYRGVAKTYEAAIAAGWLVWSDAATARNIMGGYVVLPAGLEALAAAEAKTARNGVVHASGCKCPRCLREHVGCPRQRCTEKNRGNGAREHRRGTRHREVPGAIHRSVVKRRHRRQRGAVHPAVALRAG